MDNQAISLELIKMLKEGVDQIPGLVKDVIAYNLYLDICRFIVSAVLLLASAISLGTHIYKGTAGKTEYGTWGPSPLTIICGVVAFFSLLVVICSGVEIVQIEYAPKVFMLEYIKNFIK